MLVDGMLVDGMLVDGILVDGMLVDGKPRPRPKTLKASGPSGFGLGFWPRMQPRFCRQKTPKGAFNILPRESIEYSRERP